tara:strand:+ start:673 stop:951 length:279 start_codon:yes stop_codon:yes gene_type:complete
MKPFYIVQLTNKHNIYEGYLAILDPMKHEFDELPQYAESMKTELKQPDLEVSILTYSRGYFIEGEYLLTLSFENTNYNIYIDEVNGKTILKL